MNGGYVKTSAVGSNAACNPQSWADETIEVRCFSGATATPTDSMFELTYSE
jgi:hypothetical protein